MLNTKKNQNLDDASTDSVIFNFSFKVDLSLLFSKQKCFYLIILAFSIFILVNDL